MILSGIRIMIMKHCWPDFALELTCHLLQVAGGSPPPPERNPNHYLQRKGVVLGVFSDFL